MRILRSFLGTFVLTFLYAATLEAQVSCVARVDAPATVRREGLAELVGDIVLRCTGGVPTGLGQPVPRFNLLVTLNTNVSSKLSSGLSEALMLVDEPRPGNQALSPDPPVSLTGVGGPGIDYSNPAAPINRGQPVPNAFLGRQNGWNSVTYLGVPIDPPGSVGRVVRITNLRANAYNLISPFQIVAAINIAPTFGALGVIPIDNPQVSVGTVQTGLANLGIRAPDNSNRGIATFSQCVNQNSGLLAGDTVNYAPSGLITFNEGFASAFRPRATPSGTPANPFPQPTAQDIPGFLYISLNLVSTTR